MSLLDDEKTIERKFLYEGEDCLSGGKSRKHVILICTKKQNLLVNAKNGRHAFLTLQRRQATRDI